MKAQTFFKSQPANSGLKFTIMGVLILVISTGFVWMATDHVIAPPIVRTMDFLWRLFVSTFYSKGGNMFKKSFLRGLAISSIFLVSLTISSFTMSASPLNHGMTGSVYQRSGFVHVSNTYRLDCFRRYYNFNHEKSSITEEKDASNYYMNLS
jgi:hypothetical protein